MGPPSCLQATPIKWIAYWDVCVPCISHTPQVFEQYQLWPWLKKKFLNTAGNHGKVLDMDGDTSYQFELILLSNSTWNVRWKTKLMPEVQRRASIGWWRERNKKPSASLKRTCLPARRPKEYWWGWN